jgi:hypothetical protein
MNIIRKILLTILSVALLGLGWFLEVYYYQFRFSGDGVHPIISWIIGGALTLLLTGLFLIDNNKKAFVGRIILIILSVFCTLSGQNYSYNKQQNLNNTDIAAEENKQELYNYYTEQINKTNNTIIDKNKQIPEDVKDQANWATKGVGPLREEIANLKIELSKYEDKRDAIILTLSNSSQTNIKEKSAYEMLAEDLGLSSPTPLKLISQGLLSLFFALMAPTGVHIQET